MSETTATRVFNAAVLDAAEKYIMAGVFLFFAYRMIDAYLVSGSPVTLIYFADQLTVLVFILLRRSPKELSLRVDDWAVGFAGTLLALLIGPPSGTPLVSPIVVTLFLAVGFATHFSAKLSLRRSFGVVAANRGVKESGPYRLVRHPMYLGYIISQIGILLAGPTLANVAVVAGCWALYVMRILAEERVLTRDSAYQEFSARTRYRLVPGIY